METEAEVEEPSADADRVLTPMSGNRNQSLDLIQEAMVVIRVIEETLVPGAEPDEEEPDLKSSLAYQGFRLRRQLKGYLRIGYDKRVP